MKRILVLFLLFAVLVCCTGALTGCLSDTLTNAGFDGNSKEEDQNASVGERNALKSANSYLRYTAFSAQGLIDQLEFEGYSTEEATYAIEHCGADWNEQAIKKAKSYLSYTSFSKGGLIKQLEFEKFTSSEAEYGADHCDADWNEQAVKKAESYLSLSSFSRDRLIKQLEFDGFTHEQAVYGAEENGY